MKEWYIDRLFQTDCLHLVERLPSGIVQLAYLDPPWFPELPGDEDLPSYMQYLATVLQQVRRVLRDTGCIFFHSTPSLAGIIRLTLDHVFGANTFVEEIIVPLEGRYARANRQSQQHDTIYVYGKTREPTLYHPTRPLSSEEIKLRWPLEDADGRRYRLAPLLRAGTHAERPNLCYEWHGFFPPFDRTWSVAEERLEEMCLRGEIVFKGEGRPPRRKDYLDDMAAALIGSVWSDLLEAHHEGERRGFRYAAQKPFALMRRIVEMGSDSGDLVLDPFCGTGTTLLAARAAGRHWVGGDKSPEAVGITTMRFEQGEQCPPLCVEAMPETELLKHPAFEQSYRAIKTGFEDFVGSDEPFRLNCVLPIEESREIEFKEVLGGNPVNTVKNTVDEYVVAFLNSGGGRILWGVRDHDRMVKGVRLETNQRDQLKKDITSKLFEILPPVDPTKYRVLLHDVYDGFRKLPDLCVVEVAVPCIESNVPYATGGRDVWVKTDAGKRKLQYLELVAWIQGRSGNSSRSSQTPIINTDLDEDRG